MMVFSVMTGALCVRLAGSRDDTSAVRADAEALAEWLSVRMTRARFEGAGFTLEARERPGANKIEHFKLDRIIGGINKEGAEYYIPKASTMEIQKNSFFYIYDSDYHTLTPAVSINFKSPKNQGAILYRVTVSGQGYISVKPLNGRISGGV